MASGAAFGGGGGAGLFEAVFGLTTVPVVENMTPSPLSFAEFWCPVTNGNDPIDEIQASPATCNPKRNLDGVLKHDTRELCRTRVPGVARTES